MVFYWMKYVRQSEILKLQSSHPLVFDGIGFSQYDRTHLFLSNFTKHRVEIHIEGIKPPFLQLTLDDLNFSRFNKDQEFIRQRPDIKVKNVILNPYSVNWIEADKWNS
jgi:hypothetical protein